MCPVWYLLGTIVSGDGGFNESLSMKINVITFELMHLLPQLSDPLNELILVWSCMNIVKLFLSLKTCQPNHIEETII